MGSILPVLDETCEDLDLIIMPGQCYSLSFHEAEWLLVPLIVPTIGNLAGVAFDSSLSRLGHGKGYYDRFISSYVAAAKRPRPLLGSSLHITFSQYHAHTNISVALSLQQQLLEAGQVPVTDRDWKLDMIVTPKEIIANEDSVAV